MFFYFIFYHNNKNLNTKKRLKYKNPIYCERNNYWHPSKYWSYLNLKWKEIIYLKKENIIIVTNGNLFQNMFWKSPKWIHNFKKKEQADYNL